MVEVFGLVISCWCEVVWGHLLTSINSPVYIYIINLYNKLVSGVSGFLKGRFMSTGHSQFDTQRCWIMIYSSLSVVYGLLACVMLTEGCFYV